MVSAGMDSDQSQSDQWAKTGNIQINNTADTGGEGGSGGSVTINMDSDKNNRPNAGNDGSSSNYNQQNGNASNDGIGQSAPMSQGLTVIFLHNS